MIAPAIPVNEVERQQAVEKYNLLDTMPEERYDNITAIVAAICDAPIALITLVDKGRNFIKSGHGLDLRESPRPISFCGHAILEDSIMIVKDARDDARFFNNPIVKEMKAIFYAGVPLVDSNGYKLGTLCVYDHEPRVLNEAQKTALNAMAKQVMYLFEERYKNIQLEALKQELLLRNVELKDFAGIVSHDLKAPLSNINMIVTMLSKDANVTASAKSMEYVGYLNDATTTMASYIDGMLTFYKSDELANADFSHVSFVDLMEDLITMCKVDDSVVINYAPEYDVSIYSSDQALHQILLNLITNAIKYNDKKQTIVEVCFRESETDYHIEVHDNGMGISEDKISTVFQLFTTARESDKYGNKGTGIGLATVSRLLEQLGGKIDVTSTFGEGCTFKLHIPKNSLAQLLS
ncbi:MAG: GAF domain-containing sensor histidine kinase [Nonlabens sp.]|nr:GAF domain-containing sensor histidine kinase [Nonlabens sp.]